MLAGIDVRNGEDRENAPACPTEGSLLETEPAWRLFLSRMLLASQPADRMIAYYPIDFLHSRMAALALNVETCLERMRRDWRLAKSWAHGEESSGRRLAWNRLRPPSPSLLF